MYATYKTQWALYGEMNPTQRMLWWSCMQEQKRVHDEMDNLQRDDISIQEQDPIIADDLRSRTSLEPPSGSISCISIIDSQLQEGQSSSPCGRRDSGSEKPRECMLNGQRRNSLLPIPNPSQDSLYEVGTEDAQAAPLREMSGNIERESIVIAGLRLADFKPKPALIDQNPTFATSGLKRKVARDDIDLFMDQKAKLPRLDAMVSSDTTKSSSQPATIPLSWERKLLTTVSVQSAFKEAMQSPRIYHHPRMHR